MTAIAVLGGPLSPLGSSVGFVAAPREAVRDRIVAWRRDLGADLEVTEGLPPWPDCLLALDPLESPWTTELLVGHGDGWTVYLNNHLNGGDPFPTTNHAARLLGARWVVATHQPPDPVGYASTQLWLGGPDGEPPLGYLRTIAAHAEDGRWSWQTSGQWQPFERPAAYRARLIRDRFPRALLVEYLDALGIAVDEPGRYGAATLVRRRVGWPTRQQKINRTNVS
jgi:hypothetical protein